MHGKKYSRIDVIGKGGSSKVWRVISDTGGIFALKQVSIRAHDAETRASFVNEITLLEKLRGHPQIINLIASDMTEKSLQMVGLLFSPFSFGTLIKFIDRYWSWVRSI